VQPGRAFGIDQLTIASYFEDTAARAQQLDVGAGKLLFDPRLQLESPGSVASGVAVFDAYMHAYLLVSAQAMAAMRDMQEASPC
jgi:hypothetical protein